MAITATGFKSRFPEFSTVDDSRVETFITRAELFVNEGTWDTLYNEGLYYLTAHFLKKSQDMANGGGASGPIASKSIGDVSISYASSASSSGFENSYNSTPYGVEFWNMAMIVGMQLGVVGWDG